MWLELNIPNSQPNPQVPSSEASRIRLAELDARYTSLRRILPDVGLTGRMILRGTLNDHAASGSGDVQVGEVAVVWSGVGDVDVDLALAGSLVVPLVERSGGRPGL